MARFLRRLAAACHGVCGRIAARLHRTERARYHFERVLSLGGDDFTAYVHLGRLALAEGDYAGFRREMANARSVDPERFARLRPAIDGLEPRAAGTPSEETGERATWRSVRPGGQGFLRRTAVRSAEVPSEATDEPAPRAPYFELPRLELPGEGPDGCHELRSLHLRDDFASLAERERFRHLPPIRRDDVRRADLDEISRRLSG